MARIRPLLSLPDILTPLLKSHGMEKRLLEYSLQQHWENIIGEQIGRHTWPDSIRHQSLFLIAESSTWLQQLMFLKRELLAKINAAAGSQVITDIVLRVGMVRRDAQPPTETGDRQPSDAVEPSLAIEVEASLEHIQDTELRERLRRLLMRSAAVISRRASLQTEPVSSASGRSMI